MITFRLTSKELIRRLLRLQEVVLMCGGEWLACRMDGDRRGEQRAYEAQQQALEDAADLRRILMRQMAGR